jgi:cell division protein FtsL
MAKMAERALIISFVLMVCVLLIGITLVTADKSGKSVIAKEEHLLGNYEKSDKEFKRYEISDMTIYWHQRMIDDAIVEFDYIRYEFDKNTKELIERDVHWRDGLPEKLPSIISSEQAESRIRGQIVFTKLYYISPESNVFPIKPTPKNPCWVVRSIDDGSMVITIIDAVDGEILGYGISPPYAGFALGGPDWGSCDPYYTDWAQNAETWFETMGYDTEMVDCPTDAKVTGTW